MVHDLLPQVLRVDTVLPSLSKLGVQATSVPAVCGQGNPVSDHIQELVHGRTVGPVAKHGFLTGLPQILINDTKLEIVDKNMPENITSFVTYGHTT